MSNARNYTHFGHMDPEQTTFGNLMKGAGYATCITGKWQLGRDLALPAKFGFDEYCLWQLTRRPDRYRNPGLEVNGKEMDYAKGEYGPDIVNDYALDFITRKKDAPFFLYYPMMLTHSPYDPTPDSEGYNDGGKKTRKQDGKGHFADMVTYMDKLIGKLIAKLDETGTRGNTLVLFLGDNGTGKGTPSRFRGQEVQGGKGMTTKWGTHVPFIANWPGHVPEGRVSADLIDSTDFLPTICEAAGVTLPADLKPDGRSFMPQLRGEKGAPREWLYAWYNPSGGPKAKAEFAHDAHFKLYADGRFYHVAKDDQEKTLLKDDALDDSAKAAKMKLAAAIQSFAGARPEAIAKQGEAFGGEGDEKGKGAKRKKKK
jgi:arylsulfatase A